MDWTAYIREAFARRHHTVDADVVEELSQHARASYEAARADGLSAGDARARVRDLVDGWCADAPRRRPARLNRAPVIAAPAAGSRGWTGLGQDLRYGARRLRREPGFALLAALLVALGAGTAATLGNLTYAVLLKPLPWTGSGRLVRLEEARKRDAGSRTITNATYLAWRDHPTTIENIGCWIPQIVTVTAAGGGEPERFSYASATASLFDVLEVRPILGALFTDEDEAPGHDREIVLSYGFWQRRFGGRSDIIGQTLELNADAYRIVAVMPKAFFFPSSTTQGWTPTQIPLVLRAGNPDSRRISSAQAIARLKTGVTAEQASAEGTARAQGAPDLGPTGAAMLGNQPPRVTATPYLESMTAEVRPALYILLAAVSLLFTLAVANIAGIQLARATSRRRELAIRGALGASSGRLARQMLAESVIVGVMGGSLGWLLCLAIQPAVLHLLPLDFPRVDELGMDWRLLVFTLGAGAAASVVFGVMPSLLPTRVNLVQILAEDGLAPAGGGLRTGIGRWRAAMMAGQVAIAAVLLVGAALLGRSFVSLLSVDRGYEPRRLLTAVMPTGVLRISGPERARVIDTMLGRLSQTPGVIAAAATTVMPLLPYEETMAFQMPAQPGREATLVRAAVRMVSPDYFAALGMRIVEGRGFSTDDSMASLPVVVVNRTFVRTYIAGDPVGVRLPITYIERGRSFEEIAGVVDDVRQQDVTGPPQPEIYLPYRQLSIGIRISAPVILIRTSGDPADLVPTLRQLAHEQSPSLVLDSVMTMDDRLMGSLARPRLYMTLLAVFAGFALLVTTTGLFGVLSYSVAQRTREMGIRAALGARPLDIARLVIRQGVAITFAGLTAGFAAAFGLVKFIGSLLYGVTTHDIASFVGVAAILGVVAGLACLTPARRAARIDPLAAIRK